MKEVLKDMLKSINIRNAIAVVYILLVFFYVYVLEFKKIPVENQTLVNVLGGIVVGGIGAIISYYFGASKTDHKNEPPQV